MSAGIGTQYHRNSSGFLVLDSTRHTRQLCADYYLFAHVGKDTFVRVGRMPISISRDSHCRLEKFCPAGAKRDIPNIAGALLRARARPVNAPERSAAARRSALLAERGLTGCTLARTLFPLRNGSVPAAAKPTAERIRQHRTSAGCASDVHPIRGHGVSGPDFASSRNPRRINMFTRRAPESAPAGTH